MFSKTIALSFASSAILAAATPWGTTEPPPSPPISTVTVTASAPTTTTFWECNKIAIDEGQCCNTVEAADAPDAAALLGLLGIVLEDSNVLVGLRCTPMILGFGLGASCAWQPVCCSNNNFNGVISIGCTPISL